VDVLPGAGRLPGGGAGRRTAGGVEVRARREQIFDYRYVIHDLRVNKWVLRYRDILGDRLLDWAGPDESLIVPPKGTTAARGGGAYHDVYGVDDDAIRPIQPDALLEIADDHGDIALFIEYDRTRRVDKNYDKFRRYEAFLACWWNDALPEESRRPAVIFICQDEEHRDRFINAADWQLTAHETRWTEMNPEQKYPPRDRFLFAIESDIRAGRAKAIRLPRQPAGAADSERYLRVIVLPGQTADH
jgi:hypothetical protein